MGKQLDSKRKDPRQGRSKALVDAIFEATVRILPTIGNRNLTTKKIADVAGVSIGSLYQYFPNKESVLSAVIDRSIQASIDDVQNKIDELSGHPMEETISVLVDFVLKWMLSDRRKLHEIFAQAPELGKVPAVLKLRQTVVNRLALEIKLKNKGQAEAECVRLAFIAVNSVMGVVQTMLFDEAQNYSVDELGVELKAMLNAYFRDRAGPKPQADGSQH